MDWQKDIKPLTDDCWQFSKLVARTFLERTRRDSLAVSAGHLAYVSLLSLVPVVMVLFMVMSAFPAFSEARAQVESFIFSNFVPTSGDVVQQYVSEFVNNASQMGAISIATLLVVAILLISNIDKTFNHIWRTRVQRPLIYTFAVYWMVITLGPLLIGVSIAVSSYLHTVAALTEEFTFGIGTFLLSLVPSLAGIGIFLILYMVVPNRPVKLLPALFGAVLASALFELTKQGFALYVASFPSYQVIYGALSAIPLLFIWVYLSWLVVLFGAVLTYSITIAQETRKEQAASSND